VNDRLFLRLADALIVTREDILKDYRRLRLVYGNSSLDHVVPIGSNIPRITDATATASQGYRDYRKVVFFGFIEPKKGLEHLLAICDPAVHDLFIIGTVSDHAYYARIRALVEAGRWKDRVVFAGEVPVSEVSAHLASAGAVVLPFKEGAHAGNGSLLAARLHGSFVLTTSVHSRGYRDHENVYYARPGDLDEMRIALGRYCGVRVLGSETLVPSWRAIAERHLEIYATLCGRPAG